jgi:hypothetical protein
MKNLRIIILSIFSLSSPLIWADLEIQPEYGYPECQRCYMQQQWCYDFENRKNCTDDILDCVKIQCTHYKQKPDKWYSF